MDVQTLGPAASPAATLGSPDQSAPQAGSFQSAGISPGSLPAFSSQDDSGHGAKTAHDLPSFRLPQDVARIFAGGTSPNIQVSFTVAHQPNEIVTVFKDAETGEVLSQVPSEIMVKIAEFFDQVAGVVVDKHV